MTDKTNHTYRLVISCPDQVGIAAKVTQFVADQGASLLGANNHSDLESNRFFIRCIINVSPSSCSVEEFRERFEKVAKEYNMTWYIRDSWVKQKVVLFASSASHCLADLLYRWHSDELDCEIPCVISNHENLRSMVEWYGVPFHYVPVDKNDKSIAFQKMEEIVDRYKADTLVLARYMQIIPPKLCEKYNGRLINIHHSFLPSFIGANPYQKAYERGVKLIGATCHYVTQDLDEGPIIEQDVIRVNHRHEKEELVRMGKDVEKLVLARGLRNHLEDRVVIFGNKTIVFD